MLDRSDIEKSNPDDLNSPCNKLDDHNANFNYQLADKQQQNVHSFSYGKQPHINMVSFDSI